MSHAARGGFKMINLKFSLTLAFTALLLCHNAIAASGTEHDAGRAWAEEKEISDPDDCRRALPDRWPDDNIKDPQSFTDGCLEYLKEQGIDSSTDDGNSRGEGELKFDENFDDSSSSISQRDDSDTKSKEDEDY